MGNLLSKRSSPASAKQRYDPSPEDWPWVWAIADGEVLDWKKGLNPTEIQKRALAQQQLPVRIGNSRFFLGNCQCGENADKLQELGITRVLNMAGPFAVKSKTIAGYRRLGMEYLGIHAQDEEGYPLLELHWKEAHNFIAQASDEDQNCLVHCVAGHNRSALIVAAEYMLSHQTTVLATVQLIRQCRGNMALTNESFQEQLVALARLHNLLGPIPGTPGSVIPVGPPPDWRMADQRVSSRYAKAKQKDRYKQCLEGLAN